MLGNHLISVNETLMLLFKILQLVEEYLCFLLVILGRLEFPEGFLGVLIGLLHDIGHLVQLFPLFIGLFDQVNCNRIDISHDPGNVIDVIGSLVY